MLTDLITANISQYIHVSNYHIITLYISNLHNIICQLYLNKAGEREKLRKGFSPVER